MNQIYRGYAIRPSPNYEGVLISDPTGNVVGQADSYVDARAWIDGVLGP